MEWRNIVNYPAYDVSSCGQVRRKDTNSIMKGRPSGGYLRVMLRNSITRKGFYIHRLVAIAFIDNPQSLKYVDHIDRNALNNNADNLRWITASNNNLNRKIGPMNGHERTVVSEGADNHIDVFNSVSDAAKTFGVSKYTIYDSATERTQITTHGRVWHYADGEDEQGEIWKTVHHRGVTFTVSDKGRIKAYNGKKYRGSLSKDGYYSCKRNGIPSQVHRVVAHAFVPNPKQLPFVNHIDGNKTNNQVNNLEWVSKAENSQHAVALGLIPTKGVIQICQGKRVQWVSITEASRKTGVPRANIRKVLSGERITAGGSRWKAID